MEAVVLRDARAGDAAAIAALHVASWRDAYAGVLDARYLAEEVDQDRLKLWTGRMSNARPEQHILVAETGTGQLIGFVCALVDQDPVWGTLIDNLHVYPAKRGYGLGSRLMNAAARVVAETARDAKLHLWVFEKNQRALAFYKERGGQVVERDVSAMPQAQGNALLRVYWPALEPLLR